MSWVVSVKRRLQRACRIAFGVLDSTFAYQPDTLGENEAEGHRHAAKELEVDPVGRVVEHHAGIGTGSEQKEYHPAQVETAPLRRTELHGLLHGALDQRFVTDKLAAEEEQGEQDINGWCFPLQELFVVQDQGQAAEHKSGDHHQPLAGLETTILEPDGAKDNRGGDDQGTGCDKYSGYLVGNKEDNQGQEVQPCLHPRNLDGSVKVVHLKSRHESDAMPAIDLHSHSQHSDGSLSPADLVALAAKAGVRALALTDHDSTGGIVEARLAAEKAGITLIPGVELSAIWGVHNIHVVGLQIDIDNPVLQAGLAQQAGARAERGRQIGAKLEALGMTGAYAGSLALASNADALSRTHFAQWLLAHGHVGTIQQSFDRYLGPRKPASVPMPWASLADTIAWIQAAGGTAVLAHPGRYDLSRTKMRSLIADFKLAGGNAMEVATATEKPDMVRYLGVLAQQSGLLASQGSDYHGKPAPWIAIGRFPVLPKECVPVWTAWGWPLLSPEMQPLLASAAQTELELNA